MATDIFIVSCRKDARWLEYALRSVDKYARKFRQTVVVYPEGDQVIMDPICSRHSKVKQVMIAEGGDGNLDQCIAKTNADLYSDADYFCHMDSDCLFTEEVTPLDYATDWKPDLWWDGYENLTEAKSKHPGGVPWREITAHALGLDVQVETMRRFPFVYPRFLYKLTRERIEKVHGVPFETFVRNAPKLGGAPHGYSEFNALGAAAYYLEPKFFELRNMAQYNEKLPKMKQFWSHWLRVDPVKFEKEILPELEWITEGWEGAIHAAA